MNIDQNSMPTKEEAEEIIRPIADQLRQALQKAVKDWAGPLYENVRHILSSRAQSAIIHDHIVHHAKMLLAAVPGIQISKPNGIFTVAVTESADIRFKKLDSKLRSSNVRTKQSQRYSLQLRLEGFEDLPRLTAGYVLDDLRLVLQRACVTLQIGRTVQFAIPLSGATGQQVLPYPQPVIPPATPLRRRVRAKRVTAKTSGKE